jgi:hypothetical protein
MMPLKMKIMMMTSQIMRITTMMTITKIVMTMMIMTMTTITTMITMMIMTTEVEALEVETNREITKEDLYQKEEAAHARAEDHQMAEVLVDLLREEVPVHLPEEAPDKAHQIQEDQILIIQEAQTALTLDQDVALAQIQTPHQVLQKEVLHL